MFFMHTAFSLELLVIIAALLLFLKAKKHNANVVKFISVIIILLSIANAICTLYGAVRFWHAGMFDRLFPMQQKTQMIEKAESAPAPVHQ